MPDDEDDPLDDEEPEEEELLDEEEPDEEELLGTRESEHVLQKKRTTGGSQSSQAGVCTRKRNRPP